MQDIPDPAIANMPTAKEIVIADEALGTEGDVEESEIVERC